MTEQEKMQLVKLRDQINALLIEDPPASPAQKWRATGSWVLLANGTIATCNNLYQPEYADMGLLFKTNEAAEWARPHIRRFCRMLNYIHSAAPEHDPFGCGYKLFCKDDGMRDHWYYQGKSLIDLSMPEIVAKELAHMINSGEYEL